MTAFSVLSLCADFIYKLEKLYDEVKKMIGTLIVAYVLLCASIVIVAELLRRF